LEASGIHLTSLFNGRARFTANIGVVTAEARDFLDPQHVSKHPKVKELKYKKNDYDSLCARGSRIARQHEHRGLECELL